jgi:predicted  nucleic acid-binding Zn-ribbon protein
MSLKEALQKKLESQLEGWEHEINEMEARAKRQEAEAEAEKADAEMQRQTYEKIDALKQQVEDARKKLDELHEAGEGAVNDIKAGLESTWAQLGDAVNNARSRFQ